MTAARVPQTIGVGPHRYRLGLSDIVDADGHEGTAQHRLQQIWVAANLPPSRRDVALFHELFHALAAAYDLDIHEHEIQILATGLVQVLSRDFDLYLDWHDIPKVDDLPKDTSLRSP